MTKRMTLGVLTKLISTSKLLNSQNWHTNCSFKNREAIELMKTEQGCTKDLISHLLRLYSICGWISFGLQVCAYLGQSEKILS